MARIRDALAGGFSGVTAGVTGVLFPPHCALCGTPHDRREQPICTDCARETILHGIDVCLRCGRGHGPGVGMTPECLNCADKPEEWPFDMVVSAGPYEGRLRDLVLGLKFGRHLSLASLAAAWLAQSVHSRGASVDVVVPIPLGWMRRMQRGFNQSELIAKHMAKTLEVPCLPRALRRAAFHAPQRGLTEAERKANPKGSFTKGRQAALVKGKRVLLVDDVLTTGATLRDARRVLKKSGAAAVIVAVVARTRGG